ncbi:DNA repair protein XRCC4-like [Vespa velutina]|uniref:DNA repair protein XRCC4-like n=1 Tax=Vespa velutina TaxID=202808 RepID=UPI001FB22896|nr:DNA repair protein XRCC4-like [Vespa velutina]
MSDITIVQILNEIDQIQYILYTEWKSTCFKIMLFKSSAVPLTGEMPENDINYYSQEHSKSFNEYLKETKDIFSGKNTDIQYFFQDNKFEWRRNKRWILGKITIFPISNIVLISEILYDILKQQQHLQKVISELRKENDLLKDNNKELSVNIEEMIEMKTNMEKELYKKFILILNAKKKKIRELEDSLKNTKYEQKSLFDVSTDQSEDSDTDDKSAKNIELHVGKPISYRCMNKNKDSDKKSKKSFYVPHKGSKLNSRSIVNEMEATTSRTTEKQNYFDSIRNEKMKSVSRTSSKSSNDSEDEFELRLSETCTDKHNLDFTEELEEELFS